MKHQNPDLGATSGYEIRMEGRLSDRWSAWFEGLTLVDEGDGTTVVRCPGMDQAALHGVLAKVRDLGLPLISVTRTPTSHADTSRSTHE